MAEWANNYKMKTFGVFSTPTFAGVGEPFVDTMQGAPVPVPTPSRRATDRCVRVCVTARR